VAAAAAVGVDATADDVEGIVDVLDWSDEVESRETDRDKDSCVHTEPIRPKSIHDNDAPELCGHSLTAAAQFTP
jgi:hypothetical protein